MVTADATAYPDGDRRVDPRAWWSLSSDDQGQPEDPAQDAQGLALEERPILSSLHAAHVGAMDTQYLGEGFLTEVSLRLAICRSTDL